MSIHKEDESDCSKSGFNDFLCESPLMVNINKEKDIALRGSVLRGLTLRGSVLRGLAVHSTHLHIDLQINIFRKTIRVSMFF